MYAVRKPDQHHHHYYYWDTNQPHTLIPQFNTATTFSTKSPTSLPMTDSSYRQPIDARALHSRLAVIANDNNTSSIEHGATQGRPRPSIDSTNTRPFTKSSTISTLDSHTWSTSSRLHALPSSRLHAESVGIAPGDFSKPRVPKRSRRHTMESSTSIRSGGGGGRKEREEPAQFKYYGRHGNQWLFNDFSVSGAVAKGFRRVFGGNKEGRDWYEERER
ncbi:hypothetical protein J3E72DRAFT_436669 [Bipolaris maydis]|nr:hypothetical protein J3E72DRAFT_436669 [Bipolaris maydis]